MQNNNTYIKFELSGSEIQNHISEIESYQYNTETFHGDFSDWYSWQYIGTDWDNEEYPPKIEVIFKLYAD